ncbi:MAG: hypothetical protein JNL08_00415 [Planctomycetes bacterium]|nr:hypothetical protein [Planctomycetota bacterium]
MKSVPLCLALACAGAALPCQTFADFVDSRNPVRPYASVLEVEGGAIGTTAERANPATGLDDEISWDGRVYYRDESFGTRRGTLEAYAGRDGLFAAFTDGKMVGDDTLTRFEFRGRPWQFYRDGFYDGDDYRANGFYEGSDYEGYIGFGREAQPGLYIEIGPFYRGLSFGRSDLPSPADFRPPEDYNAYGGRLYLEQNSVQLDRRRGTPRDGFMLTAIGEREWNDSAGGIGRPLNETTLPSAVWRVRGRLEWYIPSSDDATWEVFAYGGWQDEKDRVQNFEAQRPVGNQWVDAQLRFRLHLGESMTVTPFAQGQFSRVLEETGESSTKDFFFGGGVETWIHFSEVISLHGWYSYLDNENRPSVRIDEDVHGQHMFYLGMVVRIGATRR